jgi:tetratricopeptide (TPR) repeat protein
MKTEAAPWRLATWLPLICLTRWKRLLLPLSAALQVVALVGCSPQSREARQLLRAEKHLAAGDYDRAEIEYLNVLQGNRTNLTAVRGLAQIALEQGRLVRAYGLYSEAAKLWPQEFEFRLRLASLRLPGGRTEALHQEVSALVQQQPAHPEALLLWVDSLPLTNDVRELEQRLKALEPVAGQSAGYHVAMGMLLVRAQDYSRAEQSFQRAVELDAKSPKAHLGLGLLYWRQKDLARAEQALKTAAELAPVRSTECLQYADFKAARGDTAAAREWLEALAQKAPDFLPAQVRLAQLALGERRLDQAEQVLKQVLLRDAGYLDAQLLLARVYLAQNAADKAVQELEGALKNFPRLPQVHHQMAVALLAQGNQAEAMVRLREALVIQPDFAEAALLLAEIHLRRGDGPAAEDLLRQFLQRQPEHTRAKLMLAAAREGQGNLAGALQIYQDLGRTQPGNTQAALLEGLLLKRLGRLSEAQASFERALAVDPGYLPAVEQLLFLDFAASRFATAEQRVQQQIERAPQQAAPWLLLAKVQAAQTNLAAVEATLLKAVALEPASREAHLMLARVYVVGNKHTAALAELESVVSRNTNDVAAWMQIAELHTAATNYPAAAKAYERILSINSRHGPALNNLAWLRAEHLGQVKQATDLVRRARELMPTDPSTADTAGWVAYRNGDYPRALALLRESAQKLPEHPEVLYHLGMTHYMLGEEVPARAVLAKAMALAPDAPWTAEVTQKMRVLDFAAGGDPAELARLSEASSEDPLVHLRMGEAYQSRGDWQQALKSYEKAVSLSPNLLKALVVLARLTFYQAGDVPRALEWIKRARSIDSTDSGIAHLLGKLTYLSAQTALDFQVALGLLQSSSAARPADPETLFDHGRAAFAVGQTNAAIELLQRVAQAQPPSQWTQAAAEFLEVVGWLERPTEAGAAMPKLRQLAAQQPPHLPAMLVMGSVQEKQGDFKAARATYENLLQRFPLFSPVHITLARLLAAAPLNDPGRAFEHASKAREAFPNNPEVARLLGRLAFQRGDFPRAVQLLEESVRAYPADADLYYDLGMAGHRLKQAALSRSALNKALELAPDSERADEARKLLAELQ